MSTQRYSPIRNNVYMKESLRPTPLSRQPIPARPSRMVYDRTPETRAFKVEDNLSSTKLKERLTDNIQSKIESILKHNSHLLDENAALSQLLNEKNAQIETLQKKLDAQVAEELTTLNMIEAEKTRFMNQVQEQNLIWGKEKQQLLMEIQKLRDTCSALDISKHNDAVKIKEVLTREAQDRIESLKLHQQNNIELYQVQLKRANQTLSAKQHEMEAVEHKLRVQIIKLQEELGQLQQQYKHEKELADMELRETKVHYENVIAGLQREYSRDKDVFTQGYELSIRKYRKELGDKVLEVERLTNKLVKNVSENEMEYEFMKEDKEKLEFALIDLEIRLKDTFLYERTKLIELTEDQLLTLQQKHKLQVDSLLSENTKLYDLCNLKSKEIDRLNDQLATLRQASHSHTEIHDKDMSDLRQKMLQDQQTNMQELEALKVKMAYLHNGDIQGLREYYENQIQALQNSITTLETNVDEGRKRLHQQLHNKTELRKTLEAELDGEKLKNAELKVKLASVMVEMKENVASIGTKMELTSETLLRETQSKQRQIAIVDEEQKKLHQLIEAKDRQITELTSKISRLKADHEQTVREKDELIVNLKKENSDLDRAGAKEREFNEKEMTRKETLFREEKQVLENQIQEIKNSTYTSLKDQLNEANNTILSLRNELTQNKSILQSLGHELTAQKDNLDNFRLESNVALEDLKERGTKNKSASQNSLKRYYEDALKTRDKEIEELKFRLEEKEKDVRELILKYNVLEKKLSALLESQEKLRDFENKILSMGTDTNLVKNLAELLKNKAK